ncbi:unnamed protein product [Pleuronectes platessa]|uniref:Uncharacterized protein n=1 Tax=Pleuronectes platessa TaxID=8262 RepID=A0A9N7U765_PLEPL|nr:unnamed protein product [Pleuronectes platessa]
MSRSTLVAEANAGRFLLEKGDEKGALRISRGDIWDEKTQSAKGGGRGGVPRDSWQVRGGDLVEVETGLRYKPQHPPQLEAAGVSWEASRGGTLTSRNKRDERW